MRTAIAYLVGFMGAGKTEVGRRLAELLSWTFVDLDQEIERREGIAASEIFQLRGEAGFRVLEREELERVSRGHNLMVAGGGGCYCSSDNQSTMGRTGISVWLDAPIEVLFARCAGDAAARPLFTTMEAMAQLLEIRQPCSARADLHIQTAGRSVDEVAREIRAQRRHYLRRPGNEPVF
jgi:shikimate kinase